MKGALELYRLTLAKHAADSWKYRGVYPAIGRVKTLSSYCCCTCILRLQYYMVLIVFIIPSSYQRSSAFRLRYEQHSEGGLKL